MDEGLALAVIETTRMVDGIVRKRVLEKADFCFAPRPVVRLLVSLMGLFLMGIFSWLGSSTLCMTISR